MKEVRKLKIESLIQHEISSMIILGSIKDPRVTSSLSINRVEVTTDLSYARIHVTSFDTPASLARGVEALNHAAGYMQSVLGKKLNLRSIPKFTFFEDNSIAYSIELNKKIDSLVDNGD